MITVLLVFLVCSLFWCPKVAALSRKKRHKTVDLDEVEVDEAGEDLSIEGTASLTVDAFIQGNSPSSSAATSGASGCGRRFRGEVLAYVTPWNGKGYDQAKVSAASLTWLAPVWFQIRASHGSGVSGDELLFTVTGEHDVDEGWIEDVWTASATESSTSGALHVVPRVALEAPLKCASSGKDDACRDVAVELDHLRKKHGFDGYTLEIPLEYWQAGAVLSALLRHMGSRIVYVLPPLDADPATGDYSGYEGFFAVFEESVDRFSVMTYDKSKGTGEPNAPLPWVKSVMSGLAGLETNRKKHTAVRDKLLMGIPLYGWRSDGEALTGDAAVSWLQKSGGAAAISWQDIAQEHQFSGSVGGRRLTASYPTMPFLCARLALAEELGVKGVALWEMGQSLEYLMEAF